MRRLRAFLLLMLILSFALPALADNESVGVEMENEYYELTASKVDIVNGVLTVKIDGYGDTMKIDYGVVNLAAIPVAYVGEEKIPAGSCGIEGSCITFYFTDLNELPDEILMRAYEESGEGQIIWSREVADSNQTDSDATEEQPEEDPKIDSMFANYEYGDGTPDMLEDESAETAQPENDATPTDETPDGLTEEILIALGDDTYRMVYDELSNGKVIKKSDSGETEKGVQQLLCQFGQNIEVDGEFGSKSMAALNEVQAELGLEQTDTLDVAGYEALLPRLLLIVDAEKADEILPNYMDYGEYRYMCGCVFYAEGEYYKAKTCFEESGLNDWEERAEACVQNRPNTGVLDVNSEIEGNESELRIVFNTEDDTAMYAKIYTVEGVLARTMFINGSDHATASLPAGTYIVKVGRGTEWYGEDDGFGSDGTYGILTYDDGAQEIVLESGYRSTITINAEMVSGESVGEEPVDWNEF